MSEKTQIIESIEAELDVSQIKINNISIWPLIRAAISLDKFGANSKLTRDHFSTGIQVKNQLQLLKKNLKGYQAITSNSKPVDILLFSNSNNVEKLPNGKYINKFTSTLIPTLKELNIDFLRTELAPSLIKGKVNLYPATIINLHLALSLIKVKVLFKLGLFRLEVKNLEPCLKRLQTAGLPLNQKTIIRRFLKVYAYYLAFLKILKKIQPKHILYVCYYSPSSFGLALAARKLKIPTTEIQHGYQASPHLMYSHWTNFPKEGYQLLPLNFWVWGNSSKNQLEKFIEDSQHKVFAVGNPWLSYYKRFMQREFTIRNKYTNYTKNVLVTTQFLEDLYKGIIPAAMKQRDDILWFIRLHPKYRNKIKEVKTFFMAKGIKNYELATANNSNLYDLLQAVDHHITFWSTSAYEAEAFGCFTTLIHEKGKLGFTDLIRNKSAEYVNSPEELLKSIISNTIKKHQITPYMIIDEEKFIDFFKLNILDSSHLNTKVIL